MTRSKVLATLAATAVCAAALCTLAGCPSTAQTSLYTPITGFVIDSQSLTAGLGCGTGPGQVYRYAAVVTLQDRTLVSDVFNCFSNGQFANLPTADGGTASYPVAIYAYDERAYAANSTALSQCVNSVVDAACSGEDPATVLMAAKAATWTASCSATQVQGISQVAVCSPLQPTGGSDGGSGDAAADAGDGGDGSVAPGEPSILVETQGFVAAEGGTLRCATDFDHVRSSYVAGVQVGAPPEVACPAPVVIAPAIVDAGYAITATLLLGDAAVARASCQATAAPGQAGQVMATCATATPGP